MNIVASSVAVADYKTLAVLVVLKEALIDFCRVSVHSKSRQYAVPAEHIVHNFADVEDG